MNVYHPAYEGERLTGQAERVLSRGEAGIAPRARTGHGMYTRRATCQYLN